MSAVTTTRLQGLRPAPRLGRRASHAVASLAFVILAVVLAAAPLQWAVLAVAGVGLSIGMLVEPALGLALLGAVLPWSGAVALPIPAAGGADLLVGLILVLWLARSVVRREIVLRLPPLSTALLLFVWVAGLSLTQAFAWRDGVAEWLKWVEFAVLYIVAGQLLTRRSAKWLIAGLFLGGLSQVALGAYQFIRQVGPEAFSLPGGFMRAYGSFNQPNPYAGYLGYLAPVAASLALWAGARWQRGREHKDLILAFVLTAVAGALLAGIIMSWSRGGWLGLVAALIAIAGLRNWRTVLLTGAAVVLLVLVLVLFGTAWLPAALTGRVQDLGGYVSGPDPARTEITDENFSVLERLAHWQAGVWMFEDHPWLGVGIGNYSANYAHYPQPHWYQPLGHAHNVFINFAAETGLLGLAAFLAFWFGVAAWALRRGWSRRGWINALAIGVLGTWTYLTVHGLFDNLFVQHLQLQLALLLAVMASVTEAEPTATAHTLQYGLSNGSRIAFRIPHVK